MTRLLYNFLCLMEIGKLAFAGQLCLMLIVYTVQFKDAISATLTPVNPLK